MEQLATNRNNYVILRVKIKGHKKNNKLFAYMYPTQMGWDELFFTHFMYK